MKKYYFRSIIGALAFTALSQNHAAVNVPSGNAPPTKAKAAAALSNIAVPFEENHGQADAKVAFQARTLAGPLFVTKDSEWIIWML